MTLHFQSIIPNVAAPDRPVSADQKCSRSKEANDSTNKIDLLGNFRWNSDHLSNQLLQAVVSQMERKLAAKEAELKAAHQEIRRLRTKSSSSNNKKHNNHILSPTCHNFHNNNCIIDKDSCWSADDDDCAKKILSCPGLKSKQKLFLRQVLGTQAYARRRQVMNELLVGTIKTRQYHDAVARQEQDERLLLKQSLARVTELESIVQERNEKIRRLEEAAARKERSEALLRQQQHSLPNLTCSSPHLSSLSSSKKNNQNRYDKRDEQRQQLMTKISTMTSVHEIVLEEAEAKSDEFQNDLLQVIQEREQRARRRRRHQKLLQQVQRNAKGA